MKLINESFTLADHERWKDKKIVHIPKEEKLACPECMNFTTVGESFDWRCSKCGVLLQRVNPKTLEPYDPKTLDPEKWTEPEENLECSLEFLRFYVRQQTEELMPDNSTATILAERIVHAIDHVINDHCD